jgi:hypothetical protein
MCRFEYKIKKSHNISLLAELEALWKQEVKAKVQYYMLVGE